MPEFDVQSVADRRVEIPGYLLCDNPASVAGVDDEGRPGINLTEEASAGLDRLPLPPGRWQVAIESSGADVVLLARRVGDLSVPVGGPSGIAFELPQAAPIELALMARGGAAHIRRVILTNTAGS